MWVWQEWALTRSSAGGVEIPSQFVVAAKHENIASFMCSFVTGVRHKDGQVYPPLSLYQLCCSLQRAARCDGINFFEEQRFQSSEHRLFGAGVDEQLIMARTGHSSVSGVRTYKRKVEKLQEITSDVLNTSTVSTPADVQA